MPSTPTAAPGLSLPATLLPRRSINLIPFETRQRSAKLALLSPAILGVVLAGTLVAGATYALDTLVQRVQAEAAIQEVNIGLNPEKPTVLAQEAGVQAEADMLTKKTQALNALAAQELNWSRIFTFIQAVVPQDIALNSTTVNAKGATGVVIVMNGSAPSNVSFGQFSQAMRDLRAKGSITKYVQDGYTFEPQTGKVTFSVSLEIPVTALRYQVSATPKP
jgi:hypothetical protein